MALTGSDAKSLALAGELSIQRRNFGSCFASSIIRRSSLSSLPPPRTELFVARAVFPFLEGRDRAEGLGQWCSRSSVSRTLGDRLAPIRRLHPEQWETVTSDFSTVVRNGAQPGSTKFKLRSSRLGLFRQVNPFHWQTDIRIGRQTTPCCWSYRVGR